MSTQRQVFFSFHYSRDNWRAAQVKNMGVVDDSSTWSANDWEKVKSQSESAIKRWINDQMDMRSCIVVLIGKETSTRAWVKYEIEQAYAKGKGIVGVYINKLEDSSGNQDSEGANPFYNVFTSDGHRLSNYVKCFKSNYSTSKYVYEDIKDNLSDYIEDALNNRGTY
jgi:hypothetical protein